MSAGTWIGWLVGVALTGAWIAWIYRSRELPVAGRPALAVLRVAAVGILLLLLLDPTLPRGGGRDGAADVWWLLDASESMATGSVGSPGSAASAGSGDERPGSPSGWAAARSVASATEDAPVLAFGTHSPRVLSPSDTTFPAFRTSLLSPAVERAAEGGAREVRVVTDLRVADPARALSAAGRLGIRVEVQEVGDGGVNAGIAAFETPRVLSRGERVSADVVIFRSDPPPAAGSQPGEAMRPDSATVEVREEGRLLAERRVALPEPGRRGRVPFDLPPPGDAGPVRYEAILTSSGDGFDADDLRSAWVEVEPESGNLVLVSLAPDWEPRFLLPVMGQVSGLPTRGYLRVGSDRFLVMDPGGATRTVAGGEIRRVVEGAELLVVHGTLREAPGWLRDVVGGRGALALLPHDVDAGGLLDLDLSQPLPGEWYVAPDVPASPLAAELSGIPFSSLPPLGPLLSLPDPDGAVPLRARLRGVGPGEPVLTLRQEGPRRVAVVLARGLWRWAFRPGDSREAYRRLWSGVAGWLLSGPGTATGPGIRPVERVVDRHAPVRWTAPGSAGEAVRLSISHGDSVVTDTTVEVSDAGAFVTPSLPPGVYRYSADGPGGGESGQDPSDGRFEVEAWSGDSALPRSELLAGGTGPVETRLASEQAGAGRPLRAHPLPYLLLLALLSAEWIGRRRRGLR